MQWTECRAGWAGWQGVCAEGRGPAVRCHLVPMGDVTLPLGAEARPAGGCELVNAPCMCGGRMIGCGASPRRGSAVTVNGHHEWPLATGSSVITVSVEWWLPAPCSVVILFLINKLSH